MENHLKSFEINLSLLAFLYIQRQQRERDKSSYQGLWSVVFFFFLLKHVAFNMYLLLFIKVKYSDIFIWEKNKKDTDKYMIESLIWPDRFGQCEQ